MTRRQVAITSGGAVERRTSGAAQAMPSTATARTATGDTAGRVGEGTPRIRRCGRRP